MAFGCRIGHGHGHGGVWGKMFGCKDCSTLTRNELLDIKKRLELLLKLSYFLPPGLSKLGRRLCAKARDGLGINSMKLFCTPRLR